MLWALRICASLMLALLEIITIGVHSFGPVLRILVAKSKPLPSGKVENRIATKL